MQQSEFLYPVTGKWIVNGVPSPLHPFGGRNGAGKLLKMPRCLPERGEGVPHCNILRADPRTHIHGQTKAKEGLGRWWKKRREKTN